MTSQRNVCSAPLTATKKFTAFSRQDHDDIILDVANAMLVFMMVIDIDILILTRQIYLKTLNYVISKLNALEHIMTVDHLSNDNVIIVRNLKRMGVWAQQGDIIHAISAMLP